MRWVVMLATLASCNQVYGIADPTPGVGGPCDPLPFDPNRYSHAEPAGGASWMDARTRCAYAGFDLAVLDDMDSTELAQKLQGGQDPFWLGVSYGTTDWLTLDGCTPALIWAPAEPGSPQTGDCVLQTSGGMKSRPCTVAATVGIPVNALCEVPRPTPHCQIQAMERTYQVLTATLTSPVSHDAAAQQCSALNMHLLELDSTDELSYVLANVATNVPRFWIGATRDTTTWTSPTGCPQIFTWGPGQPGGGSCAFYNGRMNDANCNDGPNFSAAAICEANAM